MNINGDKWVKMGKMYCQQVRTSFVRETYHIQFFIRHKNKQSIFGKLFYNNFAFFLLFISVASACQNTKFGISTLRP